ncbi:MAG TPA: helix-turn-helix domain-containing protein [Herbaspirillum sp.]|nr:helix-turn-helix domain-containing protein [Herbaspirillum sp.]
MLVCRTFRGWAGGRKPKLTTQQTKEIKRLMSDPGIPVSQIAERYKI